jgi:hypothetical protein
MSRQGGATVRRLCGCGNLTMSKGKDPKGQVRYSSRCWTCSRVGRREKKSYCELCNFIALDPVQLDVDHIDNNPSNNDKSNLQTLCANCHRLKTKQNLDWNKNHEKV